MKHLFKKGDIEVSDMGDYVAGCEIQRPPHNYFDLPMISDLAAIYEALSDDMSCRAIVLSTQGKNFCAGGNFIDNAADDLLIGGASNPLYEAALPLFGARRPPVVAIIQGSAVGGGFGLALSADFRVGCNESRFWANFVKLGITPGFGISHTLPQLIGDRRAMDILLTARQVKGEEAFCLGLLDKFVAMADLSNTGFDLARSLAQNAPLAVRETRALLRGNSKDEFERKVKEATKREHESQSRLRYTEDCAEGICAVNERRAGVYKGR